MKIGDVILRGPYPIKRWNPPYGAAVYVIMIKDDPGQQNMYTIIYSGESDNLSDREFYRLHPKFKCWLKRAGSEDNLYICIHEMPYSTCKDRKKVESSFMKRYKPVCNKHLYFKNFSCLSLARKKT